MSERIPEGDLILPSLYLIRENLPKATSTTQLIASLTELFHPVGEDAGILPGRNDTRFSQKVRNLKSHRSANGMDIYTSLTPSGDYLLTPEGERYVRDNIDALEYLFSGDLSRKGALAVVSSVKSARRTGRRVEPYSEDATVLDGRLSASASPVRERSRKLRSAAIEHYRDSDGKIRCAVCGFCFEDHYGPAGKDYIEIHHEEPIYQYSGDGVESVISQAVKKVKPLCANCHRMIHHSARDMLTIDQLKAMLIP